MRKKDASPVYLRLTRIEREAFDALAIDRGFTSLAAFTLHLLHRERDLDRQHCPQGGTDGEGDRNVSVVGPE